MPDHCVLDHIVSLEIFSSSPFLSKTFSKFTPRLLNFCNLLCRHSTFSLSPVDVDDSVLVDKLKDVGGVHEDADGADGGDEEEEPQLSSIDDHGHVLPVLSDLKQSRVNNEHCYLKNLIISNCLKCLNICTLIEHGCGRDASRKVSVLKGNI